MNKYDFHIPFLHSLVIIAAFTLVSMGIARFYINGYFHSTTSSPTFTTSSFDSTTNHTDWNGFLTNSFTKFAEIYLLNLAVVKLD